MTDTSHRTYAVAIAIVVFFVVWAGVAARPWTASKQDPRLEALRAREVRLRATATVVERVVDRRWRAYKMALRARQAEIAQSNAQALQASRPAQGPVVRIVTLPPLTSTRTS